jgi:hypothetical protein
MPFKVLVTQPSSDPPPQSPKPNSLSNKAKPKRLAKQKAKGDENLFDDLFDGVALKDGEASALLADLDDHKPAYQSVTDKPQSSLKQFGAAAFGSKENTRFDQH